MNDKPHKVVLQDKAATAQAKPTLWLVLLAFPLLLGLLIGLARNEPPRRQSQEELQSEMVNIEAQGMARQAEMQREMLDKIGVIMSETKATPVADNPPPMQAYSCDFEPWVGMKLQSEMLESIKGAKRPYRVLKPGDAMTQDYSPARVNIEIDDTQTITRIWCG